MAEVQRVELKKIYVWRAALFGLLYGLVLGIIFSLITIFLLAVGVNNITLFGKNTSSLMAGAFITISVLIIILTSLFSSLSCLMGAALYNLIAKLGGKIHLALVEHEEKNETTRSILANSNLSNLIRLN